MQALISIEIGWGIYYRDILTLRLFDIVQESREVGFVVVALGRRDFFNLFDVFDVTIFLDIDSHLELCVVGMTIDIAGKVQKLLTGKQDS